MSRKPIIIRVAVALAMVVGTSVAGMAAKSQDAKTIVVRCSSGDSINTALADASASLIVEVSGVCSETVRVERSNVTLRGVTADAGVTGGTGDTPGLPAITISGAANVTLENLAVQDGDGHGVYVTRGATTQLTNVRVEQSSNGIVGVDGSVLRLTDCTSVHNRVDGIAVSNGCTLSLGGTIVTSENGRMGLFALGSSVGASAPIALQVDANGHTGLRFGAGARGVLAASSPAGITITGSPDGVVVLTSFFALGGALVSGNGRGIVVARGAGFDTTSAGLTVVDNTQYGMWATQNASLGLLGGPVEVARNRRGILVDSSAYALLSGVQVHDNNIWGLWVDGADANVDDLTALNNGPVDVRLSFGARVSFNGGNSATNVSCDGTQLLRPDGDISCPSSLLGARETSAAAGLPLRDRGQARQLLRPVEKDR